MGAVDRAIAALSLQHGGHITVEQLGAMGVSRDGIKHRVRTGFLIAVFRGVYAVGRLPTLPEDQAKGALLAMGDGAALSHDSAAYLHGYFHEWPDPIHVTTPRDRRPSGLAVHRTTRLRHYDFTVVREIRATNEYLTLFQIAPQLSAERLVRLHTELRVKRAHRTERELRELVARFPRAPGAKPINALLDSPLASTRSPFEVDWIPFAAKYGMPPHQLNVYIRTTRVDVLFLPNLLIVELDGWASHGTQQAFDDDRENPAEIYAYENIPTIRIARRPFLAHPATQADRLHRILAQRRRDVGLAA